MRKKIYVLRNSKIPKGNAAQEAILARTISAHCGTISATFLPISEVLNVAVPDLARSRVRAPDSRTRETAASTHEASVGNLKECLSSIAVERIDPRGLAIPCPAISGAE